MEGFDLVERAIKQYGDAIYCLTVMAQEGHYQGEKIGIAVSPIRKGTIEYGLGSVVIFRPADSSQNNGALIVDRPLSRETIESERKKGCRLTTMGEITDVPKCLVRELAL